MPLQPHMDTELNKKDDKSQDSKCPQEGNLFHGGQNRDDIPGRRSRGEPVT